MAKLPDFSESFGLKVVLIPQSTEQALDENEAITKAQALALLVLADRLEHGESAPEFVSISFAAA
jgi:predicted RNase H-like HicB family nuclease